MIRSIERRTKTDIREEFPNATTIIEATFTGDIVYTTLSNGGIRGVFNNGDKEFGVDLEVDNLKINGLDLKFTYVNVAYGPIQPDGTLDTKTMLDFENNPHRTIAGVKKVVDEKIKELANRYNIDAVIFLAVDHVEKRMSIYRTINGLKHIWTKDVEITGPKGKCHISFESERVQPYIKQIHDWALKQVGNK